jgi:hypothetical protein
MAQPRCLAVPVEHSYAEKVNLQEHEQVRSESAPKLVSPVIWHGVAFYRKFGKGGNKSVFLNPNESLGNGVTLCATTRTPIAKAIGRTISKFYRRIRWGNPKFWASDGALERNLATFWAAQCQWAG